MRYSQVLETGTTLERADCPEGVQEGLLYDILGLGRVARQA